MQDEVENRRHDLSDGFAIFGISNLTKTESLNQTAIEIKTENASIEISDDSVDVIATSFTFNGAPVATGSPGQKYMGPYIMTPKTTQQTMLTNGLVMEDDVTIEAIPYEEEVNAGGGKTATIGQE